MHLVFHVTTALGAVTSVLLRRAISLRGAHTANVQVMMSAEASLGM
jgi:hypothetical protein